MNKIKNYQDNLKLQKLEEKINYQFKNLDLLRLSITHKSLSNNHYERLEFLGDSCLSFIISDYLFNKYPDISEGELTQMKSNLVREETLFNIAIKLELNNLIFLSPSEKKTGGKNRPSILADCIESIIAAVYLDSGFLEVKKLIKYLFTFIDFEKPINDKDSKSKLQEITQSKNLMLPEYKVIKISGPEHNQIFEVTCNVKNRKATKGIGKSRKIAEQMAAELMLEVLNKK